MSRATVDHGWTLQTAATAFGTSLLVVGFTTILGRLGAWPGIPWSEIVLSALSGSAYLGLRHPQHRVLAFLVFLPLCILVLIVLGPAVVIPIEDLLQSES
jgi:hypothetical protein